jgi:hypothetical protein
MDLSIIVYALEPHIKKKYNNAINEEMRYKFCF